MRLRVLSGDSRLLYVGEQLSTTATYG